MNFHPLNVSLKNNLEVLIRPVILDDANALLHLIKNYLDTSEYIPISSSDFNKSEEDIKEWINKLSVASNSLMLVAEHNGTLIGNLDLTGHHRITLMHTAELGMGMLAEWRNTGLGTALLNGAIQWTKSNNILEIITLQVYTENAAGINLYKNLGFKEVGVIPNFIKDNGRYYDNMSMWLGVR